MQLSEKLNSKNQTIKKRMMIITISLLTAAGLLLTVTTVYTANNGLESLSNQTLEMKLNSDIHAIHTFVEKNLGSLSIKNNELVDANMKSIEHRDDFVDIFAREHGVAATIFKKDGNDFTRIMTSIRDKMGQRAVGTQLGTGSNAYQPIMDGSLYIGNAEILGVPYITAYDPIFNAEDDVIGIYFVGIPLTEVNAIVSTSTSLIIRNAGFILLIVFLAGSLAAWIFSNSLNKTLTKIIESLSDGAEQVSSSSQQLSGSSQELAESSSQQAASLQETTSSLEEMSSQIKQTAENSEVAETAVSEAKLLVKSGVEAMTRVNIAMDEIQNSSLETSKIIKTINDIAFQTNLLALNAAVEAARAGESGKGFAVVAEEVRNLAKRSAEAAQNTSELIQKSQSSSHRGIKVTNEASENLHMIEDNASKMGTLILEISQASKEQATGIAQLNTAMAEMDRGVQTNASASEESASAAGELSTQALELNYIVAELNTLVGRTSNGGSFGGKMVADQRETTDFGIHTGQTSGYGSGRFYSVKNGNIRNHKSEEYPVYEKPDPSYRHKQMA